MGQYFTPVILTKDYKDNKERIAFVVHPWKFTEGAKLTEHTWTDSPLVKSVISKLKNDLYGYPVVWCGDYGDNKLYKEAKEASKGVSSEELSYEDCRYIVNLDTKEYVEVPKETAIHPLPILTAVGNGESNSDYYGTCREHIGTWAYHRIGATDERPGDGYTELKVYFTE